MTHREDSPMEARSRQCWERGWPDAVSAFESWPRIGRSLVLGVFLAVFAASGASAHSYKLGQISIGHVWSPPPAEGDDGVPVYGAILNQGTAEAQLTGAETSIAEIVRFRVDADGVERWPTRITLSPGKPLGLAPWREHIWISGLKKPLRPGDTFQLKLEFGEKGKIDTMVIVEDEAGH